MSKERPDFIKNYTELVEKEKSCYSMSDETFGIGAPVGKKLGLEKIGIHIETLLPGKRTSWPHAESLEEEFIYVISGTPQAWIDGHIYDLKEGDFVALPAGTGITHTIINNSDQNCLLLIGGDQTIAENKVFYPLHPERNQECKDQDMLWEDCPKHDFGDHDGMPDKLRLKKAS